jgi:hypothetical protein
LFAGTRSARSKSEGSTLHDPTEWSSTSMPSNFFFVLIASSRRSRAEASPEASPAPLSLPIDAATGSPGAACMMRNVTSVIPSRVRSIAIRRLTT